MYKSFALKDTTTIQSIDKLTNKVILSFYARYVVIYVMENTKCTSVTNTVYYLLYIKEYDILHKSEACKIIQTNQH